MFNDPSNTNNYPPPTTTQASPGGGGSIQEELLHKFASSKIHIIPEEVLRFMGQTKETIWNAIVYKPPVGIVAVWAISKLITTGRIFRLYNTPVSFEQALVTKASRLDYHTGRALDLDLDDEHYQKFGGVERVRRRLALSALTTLVEEGDEITLQQQLIFISLIQILFVSFPPRGSHGAHVQKLIEAFAQVEQGLLPGLVPKQPKHKKRNNNKSINELDKLMQLSYQTAEVRTLDAMLRLARDRLLRSSFRLSRTVKHWKRRVQRQSFLSPMIQDIVTDSMERDRTRLAFAEAAYAQEIVRLGKVVGLLMERPKGMTDSHLSRAIEYTLQMQDDTVPSSWFPKISNFALRFDADGRGKLQFQHYEEGINIGGNAALNVLLEKYETEQVPWLDDAQAWSLKARSMLYDLLKEALQSSIQQTTAAEQQLAKLDQSWRTRDYKEPSEIPKQWKIMYEYIREIHKVRRVGEGKSVKLRDNNLVNKFQSWNLLGIPWTCFRIFLAQLVHQRLVVPYWPKAQKGLKEFYDISLEIVQTRFWNPIKDLMTEVMLRPESYLLTGINLQEEETSLDIMLRDLGLGDGTSTTRHDAMLKATRQYEDDIRSGLVRHTMSGRLVRLILIQVQQLKVAMLSAAETIDVLLQTNRFNIQLLAIIPAIVIVTVGTKVFFRFLFTVKIKDLRPMKAVHAEMTEYLDELESVLLLVDNKEKQYPTAIQGLNDQELGHFVLSLYDYLVLLDYSSPQPFPSGQCDAIHKAINGFLGPNPNPDPSRLLKQVRRKHNELAKYL